MKTNPHNFAELPAHIRASWDNAQALPNGKRQVGTLLPLGRGGESVEELSLSEFLEQATEQAQRNAQGRYLIAEVARMAANAEGLTKSEELECLMGLADAVRARKLPVFLEDSNRAKTLREWESYSSLSHCLSAVDANAWLQAQRYTCRLPIPQTEPEVTSKPVKRGTEKRWTTEALADLERYRLSHTEAQTAEKFGISGTLVRRKMAEKQSASKKTASPFPTTVHCIK